MCVSNVKFCKERKESRESGMEWSNVILFHSHDFFLKFKNWSPGVLVAPNALLLQWEKNIILIKEGKKKKKKKI